MGFFSDLFKTDEDKQVQYRLRYPKKRMNTDEEMENCDPSEEMQAELQQAYEQAELTDGELAEDAAEGEDFGDGEGFGGEGGDGGEGGGGE